MVSGFLCEGRYCIAGLQFGERFLDTCIAIVGRKKKSACICRYLYASNAPQLSFGIQKLQWGLCACDRPNKVYIGSWYVARWRNMDIVHKALNEAVSYPP